MTKREQGEGLKLKRLGKLAKKAEGAGILAAIGPGLLLLTGIGIVIVVVQAILRPFSWLRQLLQPNVPKPPLPASKTHSHSHPKRTRSRHHRE